MHREMFDIEFTTDEADPVVYLDQRLPHQEHTQRIRVHVDQIETLVNWLREARALLEARGSSG